MPPTHDGGLSRSGVTTYFKPTLDGNSNAIPRPRKLDAYAKRKLIFERRPKLEPIAETSYYAEDHQYYMGNGDIRNNDDGSEYNDTKSEISTQTGDSLRLPNGLKDPRLASYNNAAFESPEDLKHSEAALESNIEKKKYKKNWRTMVLAVVIIALVAAGACAAAVIFALKAANKNDSSTKTTILPTKTPTTFPYEVSFKYDKTFDSKLSDKKSDSFKYLSKKTCELVKAGIQETDFNNCSVIKFEQGSIVAVVRLSLIKDISVLELENNIKSVFKTKSDEFVQTYKPLEDSVKASTFREQTTIFHTSRSMNKATTSSLTTTIQTTKKIVELSTSPAAQLTTAARDFVTTDHLTTEDGASSRTTTYQTKEETQFTTKKSDDSTTSPTIEIATDTNLTTNYEVKAVGNVTEQIQTTVSNIT
ncbi:DgyrCDS6982 [Dimorphilus gyrociliatus]|uniref:DgyrCDS6982 n=1 Tax=Dimorphilus gyrociliatus TaxID=2664684 RepID=A0A7I8VPS8_9ANNE|nr:DgyrCDS6982 [Dimorphilus gyrociliatus]